MMKKVLIIIFIGVAILGVLYVAGLISPKRLQRLYDRGFSFYDQGSDRTLPTEYINLRGIILEVEIADTAPVREKGLSGKKRLEEGKGMLFIFETPGLHTFWMKDMHFPIDIIWFDANREVVDIVEGALPEGDHPTATYTPESEALYVLEVPANWTKKSGVSKEDIFQFCKTARCGDEEVKELIDLINAARALEDIVATASSVFEDEHASISKGQDQISSEPAQIAPDENAPSNETQKPSIAASLPPKIEHEVPFTPQAPFGEWSDERQQEGCEEASLIMASRWANGEELSREEGKAEILKLSQYQEETYGFFDDTSAADTARLYNEYFKNGRAEVSDVSIASIKKALANENLVITPMNGQVIGNPYYTGSGPERHMILIVGYDDKKGEFITNDPGTRRGEGFRYPYQTFYDGIRDYPSGREVPIMGAKKVMIVVGR